MEHIEPTEMKLTKIMGEFVSELTLATVDGFKSKHDGAIDTISMLMYLKPWKLSADVPAVRPDDDLWDDEEDSDNDTSSLSLYVV